MVKHSHKRSKRYNKKSSKRYSRKMVGGDFTEAEKVTLSNKGFTPEHIDILSNTGIGLNIIEMSLNQINPNTGAKFTPQELIDSVAEANEEIANFDEDAVVPDQENGVIDGMAGMNNMNNMNNMAGVENHYVDQGPALNMADLEPESPRSVTELGGRKRRRTMKKSRTTKKRTTKKRTMKKRKGRSQRGGNCYGNGVGANAYDPNYSIYNTNQLQLFPYRTN